MLQPTVDPTYGELVEDLGYKKVFCVDPSQLVDPEAFPIWEKQRVFRESRANKIAKAMAISKFAFPGVISVFETPEGRAIIDGQHRVGALRKLRSDNLWPDDRRILVEVHSAETEEEVSKPRPCLDDKVVKGPIRCCSVWSVWTTAISTFPPPRRRHPEGTLHNNTPTQQHNTTHDAFNVKSPSCVLRLVRPVWTRCTQR